MQWIELRAYITRARWSSQPSSNNHREHWPKSHCIYYHHRRWRSVSHYWYLSPRPLLDMSSPGTTYCSTKQLPKTRPCYSPSSLFRRSTRTERAYRSCYRLMQTRGQGWSRSHCWTGTRRNWGWRSCREVRRRYDATERVLGIWQEMGLEGNHYRRFSRSLWRSIKPYFPWLAR